MQIKREKRDLSTQKNPRKTQNSRKTPITQKSVKTAKNAKLQQGKNAIFIKSNKFEFC